MKTQLCQTEPLGLFGAPSLTYYAFFLLLLGKHFSSNHPLPAVTHNILKRSQTETLSLYIIFPQSFTQAIQYHFLLTGFWLIIVVEDL